MQIIHINAGCLPGMGTLLRDSIKLGVLRGVYKPALSSSGISLRWKAPVQVWPAFSGLLAACPAVSGSAPQCAAPPASAAA